MVMKRIEIGEYGKRVALNVRLVRKLREMTVAELSRCLAEIGHPIVDTGITKIEHGNRRIDVDDLAAFAQVLDVSPALLLSADLSARAILESAHPGGTRDAGVAS